MAGKRRRIPHFFGALACLGLTLCTSQVLAQDDAFSSDQPGFAGGTGVAPKFRLISEFRMTATPLDSAPVLALPASVFRMGVTDWLELRWHAPQFVFQKEERPGEKSRILVNLADPIVGFKVVGRASPNVVLSSESVFDLPLGTGEVGSARTGWLVDLNVGWSVSSKFTLVPNMVWTSEWIGDSETGHRRMNAALSLAGALQFTPELGAYAQVFSWFRPKEEKNLQLGVGLAWMLRSYLQVDVSVDVPVIEGAEPMVVGLGTTVLWGGSKRSR